MYPNREVRLSLHECLADALTGDPSRCDVDCDRLDRLLEAADFDGLERLFRSVLAGIPFQWHGVNTVAHYEGYYASVLYTCSCRRRR